MNANRPPDTARTGPGETAGAAPRSGTAPPPRPAPGTAPRSAPGAATGIARNAGLDAVPRTAAGTASRSAADTVPGSVGGAVPDDIPDYIPDYIIVGAMKCGTSTLAAQLGAQPGIFMTTPKEPNYFSDDAVFARGPGWYAGLLARAAPGDLRGEASTHYTKLPDRPLALARLSAALPEGAPGPRLIYLIRDPVARAVSHYVHGWSMGDIRAPIGAALHRHPELVDYGRYAMQIAPWVGRFGAARVHLDTLEAMQADPPAFLRRVGAFLGRDGLVWRDELERVNAGAERLRRGRLDAALIHSAPAQWLRRALVPQALRDRVKARRRMAQRPVLAAADRARIEAVFAADRLALHALFPGRPDLDAAYRFGPAAP